MKVTGGPPNSDLGNQVERGSNQRNILKVMPDLTLDIRIVISLMEKKHKGV